MKRTHAFGRRRLPSGMVDFYALEVVVRNANGDLGENPVRGRRAFSLRRWTVLAAPLVISFDTAPEARALEPGDLVVADELVGLLHVNAQTGQSM